MKGPILRLRALQPVGRVEERAWPRKTDKIVATHSLARAHKHTHMRQAHKHTHNAARIRLALLIN